MGHRNRPICVPSGSPYGAKGQTTRLCTSSCLENAVELRAGQILDMRSVKSMTESIRPENLFQRHSPRKVFTSARLCKNGLVSKVNYTFWSCDRDISGGTNQLVPWLRMLFAFQVINHTTTHWILPLQDERVPVLQGVWFQLPTPSQSRDDKKKFKHIWIFL